MALKVEIYPVSDGASQSGDAIRQVSGNIATPTDGRPTSTVIQPSAAQEQALKNYIGLIQRGATTSSIESAITSAL